MGRAFDKEFWGDRSRLTALEGVRCKGNWLGARPRYVRETWGESGVLRVADALGGREREWFMKPPLSFAWFPISALFAMDEVICSDLMGGHLERMVSFGEAIADNDLNVLYRAFFRLGTPHFFLARSHLIFNQYASAGDVRSKAHPGQCHTVMNDIALPRYLCRYGIRGYIRAALNAAGAKNAVVRHSRCVHDGAARCEYESTWE